MAYVWHFDCKTIIPVIRLECAMGIEKFLFANPTLRVLERSLDIQVKRIEAITSNLANIDTPKYKAVQVDFRDVFATEIRRVNPEFPVATHPGHFGFSETESQARPVRLRERQGGAMRVDGNTVDLDREMADLAQAQLQYSASVTALSRKISLIAQALSAKV